MNYCMNLQEIFLWSLLVTMDVSDFMLWSNRDYDPSYFRSLLFDEDFNNFSDMWRSNVDSELVKKTERVEHSMDIYLIVGFYISHVL